MNTKYLLLTAMVIMLSYTIAAATNSTNSTIMTNSTNSLVTHNSTNSTAMNTTGTNSTVSPLAANTASTNTTSNTVSANNYTWAFQNGGLVKYVAYTNYTCAPGIVTVYYNASQETNASKVTECETGSSTDVNLTGATPRWNLVPTFAGTSVWGFTQYGSTSAGYPVWNGMTIMTQSPGGAVSANPKFFYSPLTAINEQAIGASNGINSWPLGVLSSGAHDLLVPNGKNNTVSKSYRVSVAVYDPNIFPNATTGKCTQIAPSSLPNATKNCLTSVNALIAAVATTDNDVAMINANNILWKDAGNQTTEAAIILVTLPPPTFHEPLTVSTAASVNTSNSNYISYSFVNATSVKNVTTVNTTTTLNATTSVAVTAPTTVSNSTGTGSSTSGGSSLWIWVVVIIIIIIVVAWYLMRKK